MRLTPPSANSGAAEDDLADADDEVGVTEVKAELAMATPAPPEQDKPELYYGSVDGFVREYLRHACKRKIDGKSRVWAARWWEYDEAVIRLEALWRSWEFLRRDPATGVSVWWRDHAGHHMGLLMDPQGPFSAADAMAEENQAGKGRAAAVCGASRGVVPGCAPFADLIRDGQRLTRSGADVGCMTEGAGPELPSRVELKP